MTLARLKKKLYFLVGTFHKSAQLLQWLFLIFQDHRNQQNLIEVSIKTLEPGECNSFRFGSMDRSNFEVFSSGLSIN